MFVIAFVLLQSNPASLC